LAGRHAVHSSRGGAPARGRRGGCGRRPPAGGARYGGRTRSRALQRAPGAPLRNGEAARRWRGASEGGEVLLLAAEYVGDRAPTGTRTARSAYSWARSTGVLDNSARVAAAFRAAVERWRAAAT